jgi:hypothetical protein
MSNYQSFVSEHTLEYLLIPRLNGILKQQFSSVVPVFPWITREGGSLSNSLHKKDKFKIIGLFPRRPKFDRKSKGSIFIKINIELVDYLKTALNFNFSYIAGCPIIENLWELGNDPDCVWIKLDKDATETYELEISKDANGHFQTNKPEYFFQTDIQVLDFITENSCDLYFDQWIEFIKTLNRGINRYRSFFGGAIYKPVYFLFKN